MSVLFASQTVDNYVALGISVLLLITLVMVIVFPERF